MAYLSADHQIFKQHRGIESGREDLKGALLSIYQCFRIRREDTNRPPRGSEGNCPPPEILVSGKFGHHLLWSRNLGHRHSVGDRPFSYRQWRKHDETLWGREDPQ